MSVAVRMAVTTTIIVVIVTIVTMDAEQRAHQAANCAAQGSWHDHIIAAVAVTVMIVVAVAVAMLMVIVAVSVVIIVIVDVVVSTSGISIANVPSFLAIVLLVLDSRCDTATTTAAAISARRCRWCRCSGR